MANIKFSQFTVGNTESDIDFVVGYKGANNIQISPANLLSATLSGYLPLTGGTMSGDVIFNDNIRAKFGTGGDLNVYHDGSNSRIQNITGDIRIINFADDKDIIFQSDDGSGSITEYFRIDGGYSSPYTIFPNGSTLALGDDLDLRLVHTGSHSFIDQTGVGNLYIRQKNDDKDIIFESDNGAGSTTPYITLDGSNVRTQIDREMRFMDTIPAKFGTGGDLQIQHSSTDSFIENNTGNLFISNFANDKDIRFATDNGSGGTATYFFLDGSQATASGTLFTKWGDNSYITLGDGSDLYFFHNGTDTKMQSQTGDLVFEQLADDKDIVFKSDDGAGGVATYFQLDGGQTQTRVFKNIKFEDSVKGTFGTGDDLQVYHDGTNSYINNFVGELNVWQNANDKDIVFASDNGSGGIIEYLRLDGSDERLTVNAPNGMLFFDNIKAKFGTSSDIEIFHSGTHSFITNATGDLTIANYADDRSIYFQNDDGSGGSTTYFQLNGFAVRTDVLQNFRTQDNIKFQAGSSGDFNIFHNGSNSYLENETGDLYVRNNADDKDIIFQSDDGAGGLATYFQLSGVSSRVQFSKNQWLTDNVKILLGNNDDLEIYHSGSHSIIQDNGTGDLLLRGNNLRLQNSDGLQTFLHGYNNQGVELYYNAVKKLETRSTGIKITGVSEYADNTAAIAGGLTTGDVYRTGDLLKIVH